MVFDGGRLGAVDGDDCVELDLPAADAAPADGRGALHRLIESGFAGQRPLVGRRRPLTEVTLEAPLPRPGKIIGAPVNYVDHQHEMNQPTTVAELGVFLKAPTSVLAPNGVVVLPYSDIRTDQEAELAVVIGRTARHVDAATALDHVFGYTCALDISVRSGEDRSTRKSFDTFTPIGPWITTADEIPDPGQLRLQGWVNEVRRQDAHTADMIFDVAQLIAYASSVMTLLPGDVIITGTPAGVGPLTDGDRVRAEIERIGTLAVTVSGREAILYADRPGRRRPVDAARS